MALTNAEIQQAYRDRKLAGGLKELRGVYYSKKHKLTKEDKKEIESMLNDWLIKRFST